MATMPSRKDMKIFCVSNKLFSENHNGDSEREKAYIELSGILKLRRHCQYIPAEAQMIHVAKFFRSAIPANLASVEMWADGAFNHEEMEKASGISEVLAKAERNLKLKACFMSFST